MQRVDASGRLGAWSELRPFHVSGAASRSWRLPRTRPPSNHEERSSSGTTQPRPSAVSKYRWVAVKGTTRLDQDTPAKSYAPVARLADGTWQWTVTALDASGKEELRDLVSTDLRREWHHRTRPITLEGSGQVGTHMSVAPFNWDPADVTTTGFQWYRGILAVTGADSEALHAHLG